jgi:thiol peroxidase
LKGNPLTLEGPELKVGDKAPDATLRKSLVDKVRISDTRGKPRVFSVVPSVDTPVCAQQSKRFHEEAAKLASVAFYTISCDLPTAQARFCGAESIDREKLQFLSDHYDLSFGKAYGTAISELRVDCRAVFVVDKEGVIRYVEYVPEVASHPNYDAVLACARGLK